jgi:hypothetical protein
VEPGVGDAVVLHNNIHPARPSGATNSNVTYPCSRASERGSASLSDDGSIEYPTRDANR